MRPKLWIRAQGFLYSGGGNFWILSYADLLDDSALSVACIDA